MVEEEIFHYHLREAFNKTKNIESLTAVIPTLDPPPIFDRLRFFFSRAVFLLIELFSMV